MTSFGEEVRVRVRVIRLGLESGSESRSGLEPHFSVAGGRVCTAIKRAGHVAQRELVARVSLAAQVRRVCKRRLGFRSADQAAYQACSRSSVQAQLFRLARDIAWATRAEATTMGTARNY